MGEDTREINDHRYCSVGNGGETRKAQSMAYKSSPTPRKKKKKHKEFHLDLKEHKV